MRYKLKLKTLSSLHIGSGNTISPLEYLIEDRFYRIDMNRLFADKDFDNEAFIKESMSRYFYLGDFAPNVAKSHIRYTVKAPTSVRESLLDNLRKRRASEIREFIKSTDIPYIPGTSIKGAIRTAILWNTIKSGRLSEIENILKRQGRVDPKRAGVEIEKYIFGKDPNYDLFRVVQISDSMNSNLNLLKISKIRTFTTTPRGHTWKAFTTFCELLKEDAYLESQLKIDDWLLYGKYFNGENKEIPKKLRFANKQGLLEDIPKICNEFASYIVEKELSFYQHYDNPPEMRVVIQEYEGLKGEFKHLQDSQFLLHLAWGSGWQSMTIGSLLQKDSTFDFLALRKKFRLGKHFIKEFPKTRKVIFENNKPTSVLGWVKITLEKM